MRKLATLLALAGAVLISASAFADPNEANEDPKTQAEAAPGFLGIHLQRVEGGLAEALDMKADSGVLVRQVVDDSPAAEAGLKAGDIVTEVNGQKVGTPSELRELVRTHAAGDRIAVKYLRDGKGRSLDVTLGEGEARNSIRRAMDKAHHALGKAGHKAHQGRKLRFQKEHAFLGVSTQALSGDLKEYFGVKGEGGALVSEVVDDSPAAALGLQAGDVIIRVGEADISSPADLRAAVRSYEEAQAVQLVWVRDRKERKGETTLEMREGGDRSRWPGELGSMDIQRHLRGLGRNFPDDDLQRHVEILELDDSGLSEEMDELRAELKKLQEDLKKLQNEK
ncbi:MAG: hypothetical protein DHS20C21_20220 [Gemmatimonadota bacterium]|nr:MAG: hypothetical protein DHS20C21_20220 [Gemmatimonadota bacterium]